ncbi:MAG: kelch repeat-containing protein [Planctomycetota bacterium]
MSLKCSLLSLLLAAGVSAQTTTWTSFEDRLGHAMATDSQGRVVMFGGESVANANSTRRDLASLTASGWQENATLQLGRTEHAMASVDVGGQRLFVVFGGKQGGVRVSDTAVIDAGGQDPRGNDLATARDGHAMVSDGQKIYMFGGASGVVTYLADTWVLDPANNFVWTQVVAAGPPARRDHCMAWDPVAGRAYVFGGRTLGTPALGDLWEFDPGAGTWTDVTPVPSPPARRDAALAFLPGSGLVLFGGQDAAGNPLPDTWVYSGGGWTQVVTGTAPAARFGHAMTLSPTGLELLVLGGRDTTSRTLPGTWKFDGSTWSLAIPSPAPRDGASMAFQDAVAGVRPAGRSVLFGGRPVGGGAALSGTWELEGLNWQQRLPTTAPPARADAGLAYDRARNRAVLFGGRTGSPCGGELGDTWEWDGTSWSLRVTPTTPSPAAGVQPVFDSMRGLTWMLVGSDMWAFDGSDWSLFSYPSGRYEFGHAYDTSRNRWVVFGGNDRNVNLNETWEWDGQRWHDMSPVTSPSARVDCMMSYDPGRGMLLMCGGRIIGGSTEWNDTWEWDGANWTLVSNVALARTGSAVAFNSMLGEIQVVAGNRLGIARTDVWGWSGAAWNLRSSVGPNAGYLPSMAYRPISSALVLFGGSVSSTLHNQMWRYQGGNWSSLSPSNRPSASYASGMAYHAASGDLVLFGGALAPGGPESNQTWTWDGANWTQESPSHVPAARCCHGMFSTGSRTMLWGGYSPSTGTTFNDMWEWDGQDWNLVDPGWSASSKPSIRTNYGAAYDARRDRVVVFGGMSDCNPGVATFYDDTWEWDGDSWLQRSPPVRPSPRRCKLAYDEARSRVVLFGGRDAAGNDLQDSWEWDGDQWLSISPSATALGSGRHSLTFDRERRLSVLFGEVGTWDYGPLAPASSVTFGAGCTGSLGPISLAPLPWAGPWLGDRVEIDLVNRPPGLLLFLWGLEIAPPLDLAPILGTPPGCKLYTTDLAVDSRFDNAPRYVSFPMPTHPSFLGVEVIGQAGFYDVGIANWVTSDAVRMTFGAK